MQHRNATDAFAAAIAAGTLSADLASDNYAGNYMYMHTEHGRDHFKHIDTRVYISSPAPVGDAEPTQYTPPSAPEPKTIWNSDGTDGPCLICPPPQHA